MLSKQDVLHLIRAEVSGSSRTSVTLGPEMDEQTARRLGRLALGFAGVFVLASGVRGLAVALGVFKEAAFSGVTNLALLGWAVASASFGVYALRGKPSSVLRLGLLYEVGMCWDLSVVEQLNYSLMQAPPRVSFIALPLLAFPLVVPSTMRRRVLTTLVCLLGLPLGSFACSRIAGQPLPGAVGLIFYGPTAIAGLLAIYLSTIVHSLTAEVSQARLLGSYELTERLGAGGMGEVWRAKHRFLVRPAAVKLVRPEKLGADAALTVSRFRREAQATSVLTSPHTVAVYDFGQTQAGSFYYAMELLEGLNLESLVRLHGPVPAERVVYILEQVLLSLGDAHRHGLVHRDIKPANLFLCELGGRHDYAKVLDFGLVKSLDNAESSDAELSHTDLAVGTPAYMAPEMALGHELDGRCDLYCLGCVAYFLLTGEPVFSGDSAMSVVVQHVDRAPEHLSEQDTPEPVPRPLCELIMRCLEKSPADRPANADSLRDDLRAIPFAQPWTAATAKRWWAQHPTPAPDAAHTQSK